MIDVFDIRIGNYIYEESAVLVGSNMTQKVKSISHDTIGVESDLLGIKITRPQYCKPIPLTPEILLACGFVNIRDVHWCVPSRDASKSFDVCLWNDHVSYTMGNSHHCKLNHLHELQNLYYALTNTELKYQP